MFLHFQSKSYVSLSQFFITLYLSIKCSILLIIANIILPTLLKILSYVLPNFGTTVSATLI